MEPLFALLIVSAASWLLQQRRTPSPSIASSLRWGLAVMFTMTGIAHFIGLRDQLIAMVPPALPFPAALVTLTGAAELIAAALLLSPQAARTAAAFLTVLLVAMFPANVWWALNGDDVGWYDELLPRSVMQLVFLGATLWVCLPRRSESVEAEEPASAGAQICRARS